MTKNRLEGLSDDALLVSLKELVGRSNRITAHILAHLAEVDERRAYRTAACSSLYTYCVYELCLSEDEAQRRVTAARLVKRFPKLLRMLEDASIHLTGLLLIGPHLTDSNQDELLERARFRTKRQMQRLVAEICPRPDVSDLIQPLHPRPKRARNAYQAFVENGHRNVPPSNAPGGAPTIEGTSDVPPSNDRPPSTRAGAECDGSTGNRELSTGASADSHELGRNQNGSTRAGAESTGPTWNRERSTRAGAHPDGLTSEAWAARQGPSGESGACGEAVPQLPNPSSGPEREGQQPLAGIGLHGPPPRPDPPPQAPLVQPLSTERYRVQFTADQEHVDLVEEARDLLQHRVPSRDLSAVHKMAMRLLVKELRRSKHADTDNPRSARTGKGEGRRVPAAVKREVWERDEGRCTYVDARGQRCRETGALEFHHEDAYAHGGPTTAENLKLRCRTHNRLAAEEDFGRELIERCSKRKEPNVTRVSSGWSAGLARRRYRGASDGTETAPARCSGSRCARIRASAGRVVEDSRRPPQLDPSPTVRTGRSSAAGFNCNDDSTQPPQLQGPPQHPELRPSPPHNSTRPQQYIRSSDGPLGSPDPSVPSN